MIPKFIMYPSGVAFFPGLVLHRQYYLINAEGEKESPVSAGFIDIMVLGNEPVQLYGYVPDLALSAASAYKDWLNRYKNSGFDPEKKRFLFGYTSFFPFREFKDFGVTGRGPCLGQHMTTLNEMVTYFARIRLK